jgi:hypothetical protein
MSVSMAIGSLSSPSLVPTTSVDILLLHLIYFLSLQSSRLQMQEWRCVIGFSDSSTDYG